MTPNIILINCDDLGYGDLGCYGSESHATPALDRLAAEGMRFTDFYMASPVCSPSRGAMMTGCYPARIGFEDFEGKWVLFPGQGVGLNPDEITIARLLKDQGYATAHVGKWHCGDQPDFLPTNHGFDSYYGIPFSNDMGIHQCQKERRWPPLPLVRDLEVIEEQPDQTGLTERYVEECVGFMRRNRESPFFLYLGHMHVHRPLLVSQRFLNRSRNGAYGAAVECIDWATAALMYELAALGLEKNTLVIFTSDNGGKGADGGSNRPLRGFKGTTWEGGQRVPCIMRWPDRIPAGTTCSAMAASFDLYPTLAAIAGANVPDDRTIDGVDIRSLMEGDTQATPRDTFFYYRKGELDAVRAGHWKLFVRRNGQPIEELYNLQDDVGEKVDVAVQNPSVVADLKESIAACRQDLGCTGEGIVGENCRPIGRVENPKALTEYDPAHPYIIAAYDGTVG